MALPAALVINKQNAPHLLLRLCLALVFAFAAIDSFIAPSDWVGFLPKVATAIVPATTLLHVFSVYDLGLVVWLLSGWRSRYAGLLCALTLGGIAATNFSLFLISFRDLGLMLA